MKKFIIGSYVIDDPKKFSKLSRDPKLRSKIKRKGKDAEGEDIIELEVDKVLEGSEKGFGKGTRYTLSMEEAEQLEYCESKTYCSEGDECTFMGKECTVIDSEIDEEGMILLECDGTEFRAPQDSCKFNDSDSDSLEDDIEDIEDALEDISEEIEDTVEDADEDDLEDVEDDLEGSIDEAEKALDAVKGAKKKTKVAGRKTKRKVSKNKRKVERMSKKYSRFKKFSQNFPGDVNGFLSKPRGSFQGEGRVGDFSCDYRSLSKCLGAPDKTGKTSTWTISFNTGFGQSGTFEIECLPGVDECTVYGDPRKMEVANEFIGYIEEICGCRTLGRNRRYSNDPDEKSFVIKTSDAVAFTSFLVEASDSIFCSPSDEGTTGVEIKKIGAKSYVMRVENCGTFDFGIGTVVIVDYQGIHVVNQRGEGAIFKMKDSVDIEDLCGELEDMAEDGPKFYSKNPKGIIYDEKSFVIKTSDSLNFTDFLIEASDSIFCMPTEEETTGVDFRQIGSKNYVMEVERCGTFDFGIGTVVIVDHEGVRVVNHRGEGALFVLDDRVDLEDLCGELEDMAEDGPKFYSKKSFSKALELSLEVTQETEYKFNKFLRDLFELNSSYYLRSDIGNEQLTVNCSKVAYYLSGDVLQCGGDVLPLVGPMISIHYKDGVLTFTHNDSKSRIIFTRGDWDEWSLGFLFDEYSMGLKEFSKSSKSNKTFSGESHFYTTGDLTKVLDRINEVARTADFHVSVHLSEYKDFVIEGPLELRYPDVFANATDRLGSFGSGTGSIVKDEFKYHKGLCLKLGYDRVYLLKRDKETGSLDSLPENVINQILGESTSEFSKTFSVPHSVKDIVNCELSGADCNKLVRENKAADSNYPFNTVTQMKAELGGDIFTSEWVNKVNNFSKSVICESGDEVNYKGAIYSVSSVEGNELNITDGTSMFSVNVSDVTFIKLFGKPMAEVDANDRWEEFCNKGDFLEGTHKIYGHCRSLKVKDFGSACKAMYGTDISNHPEYREIYSNLKSQYERGELYLCDKGFCGPKDYSSESKEFSYSKLNTGFKVGTKVNFNFNGSEMTGVIEACNRRFYSIGTSEGKVKVPCHAVSKSFSSSLESAKERESAKALDVLDTLLGSGVEYKDPTFEQGPKFDPSSHKVEGAKLYGKTFSENKSKDTLGDVSSLDDLI